VAEPGFDHLDEKAKKTAASRPLATSRATFDSSDRAGQPIGVIALRRIGGRVVATHPLERYDDDLERWTRYTRARQLSPITPLIVQPLIIRDDSGFTGVSGGAKNQTGT
jgi:hypothetical protein